MDAGSIPAASTKNQYNLPMKAFLINLEKAEDRFSITSKQDTPFVKRNDLNDLIEDIKVSLN